MRAVALVLAAMLAVTAWPAAAAPRKHPKRAKVHRKVTRASERLVDLTQVTPPAPPNPPSDPVPATFVSVAAKEFSLTLSRPLVGKGSVRVELRNNGEDPHNLVMSPEGTHTPLASFSTLGPGTYERRSVTLDPGRYQLWCSLEGHEAKGMSVTLRVQ
ncbi:MAG TPA: hypothetical protein VM824_05310 [Thermoleophilaceae bacterium]|jgi:hypothetical protein|nr:hypothetical protein [Thermoleophilaceae bacterium]